LQEKSNEIIRIIIIAFECCLNIVIVYF